MEDFQPKTVGPPVAAGAAGESNHNEPGRLAGEGAGAGPATPGGAAEVGGGAGAASPAGAGQGGDPAPAPGGPEPGGHAVVPPAVYWRRRAVALAVGIGLLTILVWAVNGTLSNGATSSHGGHGRAGSSRGHGHGRTGRGAGHGGSGQSGSGPGGSGSSGPGGGQGGAGGGASAGSAGHASTAAAAQPGAAGGAGRGSAPASPSPGVPASPAVSPSATPSGGAPPGGSATPPAGQVPACGPGDVALSLFTPKYWYERGQLPRFVVAAVSASGRPCRFNMGAKYVAVVVNYGTERIWSSADCARGASSRGVVLTKEQPAVSWITWNRRTSVPGCRPGGHAVKGATYTVTAVSGQLRSQGMVIVLDAPGLSVP